MSSSPELVFISYLFIKDNLTVILYYLVFLLPIIDIEYDNITLNQI